MNVYESIVTLPRPRVEVFEFLRRPANLMKIFQSNLKSDLSLKIPEVMNTGDRIEFNFKTMGHHFEFVHQIVDVRFHERIALEQIQGPFKTWKLEHHFADSKAGETLLKTVVVYEPPAGLLGFVVTRHKIHSYLGKWIPQGHEMLRHSLASSQTQP